MSTTARRSDGVQVLSRATHILRALAGRSEPVGLGELSRQVGLPRSTVYRIALTLAAEGFVEMGEGNRGLRIGPELARLAGLGGSTLVQLAHPFMERLSLAVNETVDLAVLDGSCVRFVDQVAGSQRLRAVSVVGEAFPLHSTANGKALLAALAPEEARRRLSTTRLARLTEHTIVSRQKLLSELAAVRRSGVAYDREEHTLQICAVGAAVRSLHGDLGALTVAAPAQRFYGREDLLAGALLEAADGVNAALRAPGMLAGG